MAREAALRKPQSSYADNEVVIHSILRHRHYERGGQSSVSRPSATPPMRSNTRPPDLRDVGEGGGHAALEAIFGRRPDMWVSNCLTAIADLPAAANAANRQPLGGG